MMENNTGNMSDTLLARVVIVIPAFWEDCPIRKNMEIKSAPKRIPDRSHGFECINSVKSKFSKTKNPKNVATK